MENNCPTWPNIRLCAKIDCAQLNNGNFDFTKEELDVYKTTMNHILTNCENCLKIYNYYCEEKQLDYAPQKKLVPVILDGF